MNNNSILLNIRAVMDASRVKPGAVVVKTAVDDIQRSAQKANMELARTNALINTGVSSVQKKAKVMEAATKANSKYAHSQATLHNSEIFIQKAWERGSNLIDRRYLSSVNGLREGLHRLNREAETTIVTQKGVVRALSDPRLDSVRAQMRNDLRMRTASNMAQNFVNKSKNTQWTGRQMMVGVTAPIAAIGAISVASYKELGNLEVRIRKVLRDSYGSSQVTKELDIINDKARGLSERFGVLRTEIMSSAETFAKAGILGKDLSENLTLSTELKIVGDVDADTSAELVRVLAKNGYNPEQLADQLQKLNRIDDQTNITLQGMANALVEVQPLMQGFGVTAAETAALVAGITQAGYSEMESAIAIRNLFTKMPSAMANLQSGDPDMGTRLKALQHTLEVVRNNTGINIEVIDENGSIKNGIELVTNVAAGMEKLKKSGNVELSSQALSGLRNLFGAEQAGEGRQFFDALSVAIEGGSNDLFKALAVAQGKMGSSVDAWNEQLEEWENSDVGRMQKNIEKLRNSAQDLGKKLMPVATKILGAISDVIDKFMNLPEGTQNFLLSMAGLLAIVGPITYAFGQLGVLFGTIAKSGISFLRKMVPGLGAIKTSAFGVTAAVDTIDDSFRKLVSSFRLGEISQDELVRGARELSAGLSNVKTEARSASHALDEIAASSRNATASVTEKSGILPERINKKGQREPLPSAAELTAMNLPVDPEYIYAKEMSDREVGRVRDVGRDRDDYQRGRAPLRANLKEDIIRQQHGLKGMRESAAASRNFSETFGFDLPFDSAMQAGDFMEDRSDELYTLAEELASKDLSRKARAKKDLVRLAEEYKKDAAKVGVEADEAFRRIASKDPEAAENFRKNGYKLQSKRDVMGKNKKTTLSSEQYFRERLALFDPPEGDSIEARRGFLDKLMKDIDAPARTSFIDSAGRADNAGIRGATDDLFNLNKVAREYGFLDNNAMVPPVLDEFQTKGMKALFEDGPDRAVRAHKEDEFEKIRAVALKKFRGEKLTSDEQKLAKKSTAMKNLLQDARAGQVKEKDPIQRRPAAWRELKKAFGDSFDLASTQGEEIDSFFQNLVSGNLDDLLGMEGGDEVAAALSNVDAGLIQDRQKEFAKIMGKVEAANVEVAKFSSANISPPARLVDEMLAAHEEMEGFKRTLVNSNDEIASAFQMLSGKMESVSYSKYAGGNSAFARELSVDSQGRARVGKTSALRRGKATIFDESLGGADSLLDDITGGKNVGSNVQSDRNTQISKELKKAYKNHFGIESEGDTLDTSAVGRASVDWQEKLGFKSHTPVDPGSLGRRGGMMSPKSWEKSKGGLDFIGAGMNTGDIDDLIPDSITGGTREALADSYQTAANAALEKSMRDRFTQGVGQVPELSLKDVFPTTHAGFDPKTKKQREGILKKINEELRERHSLNVERSTAAFNNVIVGQEKEVLEELQNLAYKGDIDGMENLARTKGLPKDLQEKLGASLWAAPSDDEVTGMVTEAFGLQNLSGDDLKDARAKSDLAFNELQQMVAREAGASPTTMDGLRGKGYKLKADAAISAAKDSDLTPDMMMPGLVSDERGIGSWYADIDENEKKAISKLKSDISKLKDEKTRNGAGMGDIAVERDQLRDTVARKELQASAIPEQLKEIDEILERDFASYRTDTGGFAWEAGDANADKLQSLIDQKSSLENLRDISGPTTYEIERLKELEEIDRNVDRRNAEIQREIDSNQSLISTMEEQSALRKGEIDSQKELRQINKDLKRIDEEAMAQTALIADEMAADPEFRKYQSMLSEKDELIKANKSNKAELKAAKERGAARLSPLRDRHDALLSERAGLLTEASRLEADGKAFEAGSVRAKATSVRSKIMDSADEIAAIERDIFNEIDPLETLVANNDSQIRSLASKTGAAPQSYKDMDASHRQRLEGYRNEKASLQARRGDLIGRSKPAAKTRSLSQLGLLEGATEGSEALFADRASVLADVANNEATVRELDDLIENASSGRQDIERLLQGKTISKKNKKKLRDKHGLDIFDGTNRDQLEELASELDEFVDGQKAARAQAAGLLKDAESRLKGVGLSRGAKGIVTDKNFLGATTGLEGLVGTLDDNVAKALNDITVLQIEDPKKAVAVLEKYGVDMLAGVDRFEGETDKAFNARKAAIRDRWGKAGIRTGRQIRSNVDQAEALFGEGINKAILGGEGTTTGTNKDQMGAAQMKAQKLMREKGMTREQARREIMKDMVSSERRMFNPQDTITSVPEHSSAIELVAGGSGEFLDELADNIDELDPNENLRKGYESTDDFKKLVAAQAAEHERLMDTQQLIMEDVNKEYGKSRAKAKEADRDLGQLLQERDRLVTDRNTALDLSKQSGGHDRDLWKVVADDIDGELKEWDSLNQERIYDLRDFLDDEEHMAEVLQREISEQAEQRKKQSLKHKGARDDAFNDFMDLDPETRNKKISPVYRDVLGLEEGLKTLDDGFTSQISEFDSSTDTMVRNMDRLEELHRQRADALDNLARGLQGSAGRIEGSAELIEKLDSRLTYMPDGSLVLADTGRTVRDEAIHRTDSNISSIEGEAAKKRKRESMLYGPFANRDVGQGLSADQAKHLNEMQIDDIINGRDSKKYSKLDIEDFVAKKDRSRTFESIRDGILSKAAEDGLEVDDNLRREIDDHAERAARTAVPLSTLEARDADGKPRGSARERATSRFRAREKGQGFFPATRRAASGAGDTLKGVGQQGKRGFGLGSAAKGVGKGAAIGAALPIQAANKGVKNLTTGFASLGKVGKATGGILEGMFLPMNVGLSGAMGTVFSFLPVILLIAGIALLIWKNWDKVKKGIGGALDRMREAGQALINAVLEPIRGLFAKLGDDNSAEGLGNLWENVGKVMGFVMDIISGIMRVIAPVIRMVMEYVMAVVYNIIQVFRILFAVFTGDWDDVWEGIKNIFSNSWNAMRGIAAAAINGIIELVFWMGRMIFKAVEGIAGVAVKIINLVNPGKDFELPSMDKFFSDMEVTRDYITNIVDKKVGGSDTFSARGKKKGKEAAEAATEGAKDAGGAQIEPVIDMEKAAADGRDAAEKMRDAFFRRMDEIVEGWKKAALDAFDDWAKAQVQAIDDKLEAIDKEVEAERRKQQDLDYLQKKEENRNKRRTASIRHTMDRALAIYEGRYDDAAQMDFDFQEEIATIDKEAADIEKDRQEVLTDRVRQGEIDRLNLEKDSLNKRHEAQRNALQKQLDAITEYGPLTAAAASKMHQDIFNAMKFWTDKQGMLGAESAENWNANWSTAMAKAKTDVEYEAKKAGEDILQSFADGLGVIINVPKSEPPKGYTPMGPGSAHHERSVNEQRYGKDNVGPDGKPIYYHTGGSVGSTSMAPSDVPATLQTGEYVIRRSAVAKLGKGYLDEVNRGERPVFHSGGLVGNMASMAGAMARRATGNLIDGFKAGSQKVMGGSFEQLKGAYTNAAGGGGFGSTIGGSIDVAGKSIADIVDHVVKGTHPELTRRLKLWNAEMGHKFNINSGYRSMAEQAYLYDRWMKKVPGQAQAARPGRSNHNYGLAVDLKPSSTTAAQRKAGEKYGLRWPMSFEPWHVEPVEAGAWRKAILGGTMPGGGGEAMDNGPFKVRDGIFASQEAMGGMTSGASVGRAHIKSVVRGMLGRFGWGDDQWPSLDKLIAGESSWNPNAANSTSSARGLFQKMTSLHGPLESTIEGQAGWGLNYIKGRYGSPSAAYAKWNSRKPHWYHGGGMVFPSLDVGGKILEDGLAKVHKGERVLTSGTTSAVEAMAGNTGGDTYRFDLHFEGGFFGTDRELEKLQAKLEQDIAPKLARARGINRRVVSNY